MANRLHTLAFCAQMLYFVINQRKMLTSYSIFIFSTSSCKRYHWLLNFVIFVYALEYWERRSSTELHWLLLLRLKKCSERERERCSHRVKTKGASCLISPSFTCHWQLRKTSVRAVPPGNWHCMRSSYLINRWLPIEDKMFRPRAL
jgi:hypothetical protein